MQRYRVFLELRRQFSIVAKTRLMTICGIDPSREQELSDRLENPVDKYAQVKEILLKLYKTYHGNMGRVRATIALRKFGIYLCDQTVRNIMKELGLIYVGRRKSKYSSYQGNIALSPNYLQREFESDFPMEKVVTDVTEIRCSDRSLYLSVFLDTFSNEVVASTISSSPSSQFVMDGLNIVLKRLPTNRKCIIHSDQGIQYQTTAYRQLIHEHPSAIQSMSRKGNCLDNGACESFFGVMKNELRLSRSLSYDEVSHKLASYIEFYNNTRIQEALNGMSPIQYRMNYERLNEAT